MDTGPGKAFVSIGESDDLALGACLHAGMISHFFQRRPSPIADSGNSTFIEIGEFN